MALMVHHTKLRYLGLVSLREVKVGNVAIYRNAKLCNVNSFNWTAAKLVNGRFYSSRNADDAACRKQLGLGIYLIIYTFNDRTRRTICRPNFFSLSFYALNVFFSNSFH